MSGQCPGAEDIILVSDGGYGNSPDDYDTDTDMDGEHQNHRAWQIGLDHYPSWQVSASHAGRTMASQSTPRPLAL